MSNDKTGDMSDTITAKSDQLNAADLFGGSITVKITRVDRVAGDQPAIIHIDGGYQPFKPCLGMRRVLVKLWGKFSSEWVGKSMTLFCEDSVTWAGKAVGGIRISHLEGLQRKEIVVIRVSKLKTTNYEINPLKVEALPAYTDEDIAKNTDAWAKAFMKPGARESLIAGIEGRFTLTDEQVAKINSIQEMDDENAQDE